MKLELITEPILQQLGFSCTHSIGSIQVQMVGVVPLAATLFTEEQLSYYFPFKGEQLSQSVYGQRFRVG